MPNQPAYTTLEIYNLSKKLVLACYEITHDLPLEEKTNLVQYIRTAAVTMHLNIASGLFLKKKKERKQAFITIQNALTIIHAAVEVLLEVQLASTENCQEIFNLTASCGESLDNLKKQK